jgi:hypothetical protein
MWTAAETAFAQKVMQQAILSGVSWPGYMAAEACLESFDYESPNGMSSLASKYNNIFGQKASKSWTGPTVEIQTREVINGESVMVPATWPVFANFAEAFADRLQLLRDAPEYYAESLAATNGDDFVRLVSAKWGHGDFPVSPAHPVITFPNSETWQFDSGRWSTAPNRAQQVLQVYYNHPEVFAA